MEILVSGRVDNTYLLVATRLPDVCKGFHSRGQHLASSSATGSGCKASKLTNAKRVPVKGSCKSSQAISFPLILIAFS
jgi:hypothetical protein